MRLVVTKTGWLIAAPGRQHDPDAADEPPVQRFVLPAGTRRIAWRLTCASEAGCSVAGVAGGRRRDPLGHPAIFSAYRVRLR
jgi:hypothetical protein